MASCRLPGLRLLLVAVVLVLATVALDVVSTAPAGRQAEPHTIQPWHKIGRAGLGMVRSSIADRYGRGSSVGRFFQTIRVPGGHLQVGYAGSRVSWVSTDSGYYRTADGVGVGTRIPLGACHETRANRCERRWQGFVYQPAASRWYLQACVAGIPSYATLSVRRGRVTAVSAGFGSEATCTTRRLPPLSRTEKAAIRRVLTAKFSSETVRVRVGRIEAADSTRDYAAAVVRGTSSGQRLDPLSVIVHHQAGGWTVVSWGTSGVGCGIVPLKILAELAFTCP